MHLKKKEENKEENAPAISDWVNDPFNTAMDFFGRPFESLSRPLKDWWGGSTPSVDISENDKEVIVRAEVPGMVEKDLSLSYTQGTLTLEGEKKIEEEHTKGESKIRESRYGSFRRDIPLGENLMWENAKANCKNGILTVKVPKTIKKEEQKKKIVID